MTHLSPRRGFRVWGPVFYTPIAPQGLYWFTSSLMNQCIHEPMNKLFSRLTLLAYYTFF